jgi:hypothetical protein
MLPQQAAVGYQGGVPGYPQAVVVGAPTGRLIDVIVPQGVMGGSLIEINDPLTGQAIQAIVPQGLGPGMRFEIQVPFNNFSPKSQQYVQQPFPQQQYVQQPYAQNAYGQQQYGQQAPGQRYTPPRDDSSCGAFLAGLCVCCTFLTLFGGH